VTRIAPEAQRLKPAQNNVPNANSKPSLERAKLGEFALYKAGRIMREAQTSSSSLILHFKTDKMQF
jgi:hypothetical protein